MAMMLSPALRWKVQAVEVLQRQYEHLQPYLTTMHALPQDEIRSDLHVIY